LLAADPTTETTQPKVLSNDLSRISPLLPAA
jgi:hypothetical protein